tara:strand:+ start:3639 stop:3929 length:291 start_codon:yes stop_codon:yes gene_type:complete
MGILKKICKKSPLKTSGHGGAANHFHNYELDKNNAKKYKTFRQSLEYKYPIQDFVGDGKRFKHSNQYSHMITKKIEGYHDMINAPTIKDPKQKPKN